MGAVLPEALAAWAELSEDIPDLGLLAITSPDLLHRGWSARHAGRWTGGSRAPAHAEVLLNALVDTASLVTVIDGAPSSAWRYQPDVQEVVVELRSGPVSILVKP